MADFDSLLQNSNIQAFLKMLRVGEGTSGSNGYNTIYTGKTFSDYSKHPRKIYCSGGICSDAAGAYQFLSSTWADLVRRYGGSVLPDFSPTSQDKGALIIINERGATQNIVDGDIESAINKVKSIWASLPNAGYGQKEVSVSDTLANFVKYGGTLLKKAVVTASGEIISTTKKIDEKAKRNPIPTAIVTALTFISIYAIFKSLNKK
jgi:muramidase (phage lysozyme)